MERRTHVTPSENLFISKDVIYAQPKYAAKPNGLWYGIDNSYINFWFDQQGIDILNGKHIFDLDIKPDSFIMCYQIISFRVQDLKDKILVIESEDDVIMLSSNFKSQYSNDTEELFIDWQSFSSIFGGIEIRHFDPSLRFIYSWYSYFDCDGGCIWNLDLLS